MKKILVLSFAVISSTATMTLIDDAWPHDTPKRPYVYVSLNEAAPEGFDPFSFFPESITDDRRVYGTLYACGPETCSPSVAVYRRGVVAVLNEGYANTANNFGIVGGSVVLDLAQGATQAALFVRNRVKLIPPLLDEVTSDVSLLTDSGIAFVNSGDLAGNATHYLTRRGDVTPLDFGPAPADQFDINDRGRISGTSGQEEGDRAFRYNPFSGRFTLLDPLPTEPDSWGQAINRRGDVLGYSFIGGGLERIGVWHGTEFRTYFVEGTPEFSSVSNHLLWNERGLIVITDVSRGEPGSYLVPRPGVRLNLADLTDGPLPVWTWIFDINNRGDMIGWGGERRGIVSNIFLLRRVGPLNDNNGSADDVAASSSQPEPAAAGVRVRHAAALERILHERLYGGLNKSRAAGSAGLRRR